MSTEKFKNINIDDIIGRIKEVKGFSKEHEIAKWLGFTRSAFSQRKNRESFPSDKIELSCNREGINFDWIMFGEGEKLMQNKQGGFKQPIDLLRAGPAPVGHNERVSQEELIVRLLTENAAGILRGLDKEKQNDFLIDTLNFLRTQKEKSHKNET
jgi:hypothetical protein